MGAHGETRDVCQIAALYRLHIVPELYPVMKVASGIKGSSPILSLASCYCEGRFFFLFQDSGCTKGRKGRGESIQLPEILLNVIPGKGYSNADEVLSSRDDTQLTVSDKGAVMEYLQSSRVPFSVGRKGQMRYVDMCGLSCSLCLMWDYLVCTSTGLKRNLESCISMRDWWTSLYELMGGTVGQGKHCLCDACVCNSICFFVLEIGLIPACCSCNEWIWRLHGGVPP